MSDPREVDALQDALAAEHAVVWGYGVVGARVGDPLRPEVDRAAAAHRARRGATVTLLRDVGAGPVASEPSYDLPFPVTTQDAALRLAVHLEEGAAAAWHHLLGNTTDERLRRTAAGALAEAAVRATRWRTRLTPTAASVAFPGADR